MILLSIIVPFYNNSKYLKHCIKSLKCINNSQIEIIFIDDGSTENEFKLLKNYIKKLPNKNIILLRNDQNKGAGFTKNRAIQASRGKYIILLDSDDSVDKNYYSKLLRIIEEHNADIVCTDIALKYDDYTAKSSLIEDNFFSHQYKKIDNNLYSVTPEVLLEDKFVASACNKIINREFFKKYNFNENRCDDLTAIIPIVCSAKKILYVNNLYYYYYQSNFSLTRNSSIEKYIDSIDSLMKTVDILLQENISLDRIQLFFANNIIPFIYTNIINNKRHIRKKLINHLRKISNEKNFNIELILKSPYIIKNEFMTPHIKKVFENMIYKKYGKVNRLIIIGKLKYKLFKI